MLVHAHAAVTHFEHDIRTVVQRIGQARRSRRFGPEFLETRLYSYVAALVAVLLRRVRDKAQEYLHELGAIAIYRGHLRFAHIRDVDVRGNRLRYDR